MKITSINSKESDEHNLALNTEPKLTDLVFDHFKKLWVNEAGALGILTPHMSELSGALIFYSANSIDVAILNGFTDIVDRLLGGAEALVQHEAARKREQADRENQQRKGKIQAVSKTLGIPIK